MIWYKCTEGEYGDFLFAWATHDVEICPGLPKATAVVGVFDLEDDDEYYHLLTSLLPYDDDCDEADLFGIVEMNAPLQYDRDSEWLGREARYYMSLYINKKPGWFINWYKDAIREELERQGLAEAGKAR